MIIPVESPFFTHSLDPLERYLNEIILLLRLIK